MLKKILICYYCGARERQFLATLLFLQNYILRIQFFCHVTTWLVTSQKTRVASSTAIRTSDLAVPLYLLHTHTHTTRGTYRPIFFCLNMHETHFTAKFDSPPFRSRRRDSIWRFSVTTNSRMLADIPLVGKASRVLLCCIMLPVQSEKEHCYNSQYVTGNDR